MIASVLPPMISTTTTSEPRERKLDRNSPIRVYERYVLKPTKLLCFVRFGGSKKGNRWLSLTPQVLVIFEGYG